MVIWWFFESPGLICKSLCVYIYIYVYLLQDRVCNFHQILKGAQYSKEIKSQWFKSLKVVNYLSNFSRLLLGTEPAHNTSPRHPKTSKASLRKELFFLFLLPPPPSPSWALPLPRVLSVAIPKASSFLS